MAARSYTHTTYLLATGQLQWGDPAIVFRAMLVGAGYVYSAAHIYASSATAHELSGGSYSRVSVVSRTVDVDYGTRRSLLDADDVEFASMTGSPASCLIFKRVGPDDSTPGDDPLVLCIDTPPPAPSSQVLRVEFDPVGAIALVLAT